MVFPVVMYGCESWTIKEAEQQRIDAFELRCWRRFSRVPWTTRRSIQSILKEISPEYALEGLMLKLKRQCFGHLMGRADSFEKTLMLGKIEGMTRRGQQCVVGWAAELHGCAQPLRCMKFLPTAGVPHQAQLFWGFLADLFLTGG